MKVLIVLGTRPEAIKLAPLILRLRAESDVGLEVCTTGQHRELTRGALGLFGITPDHDLDLMAPGQDLSALAARILAGLDPILREGDFDRVIVQGDTTSAMTAALAAAHRAIPVAHVEAGLRSGDAHSPWPEETNRQIISRIADLHFAPTAGAAENLRHEGIAPLAIHVTGNTGIDALFGISARLAAEPAIGAALEARFATGRGAKLALATMHRRENLGQGLAELCAALRCLGDQGHRVIFPAHPNPKVRLMAQTLLRDAPNLELVAPLDYPSFVWLMGRADLILTDSGGIQEEATALGKQALVLRQETERPEALTAGTVRLVMPERGAIVALAERMLRTPLHPSPDAAATFGDGKAAGRIAELLLRKGPSASLLRVA